MPPNVPPPYPRSPTGEIDALKSGLDSVTVLLRTVSDELANERKAREAREKQGVSVLNIHVPLVVVLGLFTALAGTAIVSAGFYHKSEAHFSDSNIHLKAEETIAKGGPAYKKEVADEIASAASDVSADVRRVSRAVRDGAQCKPSKIHGEFSCAFADPETLKLRPP